MNPSQHQPNKNETTSRQDYRGGDDDYRDEYIEGEVTGYIDVMKQPVNNVRETTFTYYLIFLGRWSESF